MSTTLYALHLGSGQLKTVTLANASTLYRDTNNDTLFTAFGTTASALLTAATRSTGTWKRRVVMEKYETFGWLEVESDFTDANGSSVSATVTISDSTGATITSATVSDRTPVRLAPFEEKEFIITIASKARITAVKLASTTRELKAL